ncbi:uncharacterized mitochondrial protein AtMg00810-like [Lactuca sativa]|uniref:uncharacterized mitochondrial protein AtMg00810-like n=1 Tax=Lactuca sativa TaxID=4236 RepID=UPI001C68DD43|nr:uncharacterized mitochondrial protein AtMg00810-like [Lactuca sativa]
MGELKNFLGLEHDHTKEGLFLCQQKYTRDILQKCGMLECKLVSTPIEANAKIYAHEGKKLDDGTMYRKLVGSLIYLTLSRPDIAYAVGVMSRHMQFLKKTHLDAARRILRYVKGDHDTQRSINVYVFKLGLEQFRGVVKDNQQYHCQQRKRIKAAAVTTQESRWLVLLMEDIHQKVDCAVPLHCDNQSAIRLVENLVFHARTKYVEVNYHFIRENVLKEEIEMRQIKTDDQIADLFTKGLSTGKYVKVFSVSLTWYGESRYLKGTKSLGIWYPANESFLLQEYSDSNYGGLQLDRKTTLGGCQFLDGRLVSWSSKKHNCIALSTTEAEYIVAISYTSQVLWMKSQLLDYGYRFQ